MIRRRYRILILGVLLLAGNAFTSSAQVDNLGIVPRPESVVSAKGDFEFTNKTKLIVENEEQKAVASQFAKAFDKATGWNLTVTVGGKEAVNSVVFKTDGSLAAEAYSLEVKPSGILIKASKPAGFFYALQTIRELLPVQFEQKKAVAQLHWKVPGVVVADNPRFPWRGYMLDVTRHFFSKEELKKLIDVMALHKMNVFHLHLVDDQGWRVEIKKYPKLTEVGAWRVNHEDLNWNARPKQQPGEKATYGGFYSQDDIRELVAYAQSRFITILPEIEMPAHVTAALAAYPELSCTGGPFTVYPGGVWPVTDIYCAGNDKVFSFLEDVLTEVMDLFPSKYIHIGGDEATKTNWEACPKCNERVKKEGLKNVEELQSYFIRRMESFINSKGRTLIGWDEILQGGLAPNATVMSWRGYEGGVDAVRQGHDVVMTPTSYCYFDYYQGTQDQEPLAIGGYLPLRKVYDFNPVPKELNAEQAKHILGGQANLWTEYVPVNSHLEYMTLPRLAAMAEALWTPEGRKDWKSFANRMENVYPRYQALGLNYSKSAFNISLQAKFDPATKKLNVSMKSETGDASIFYTLDGKKPGPSSKAYTQPVEIKGTGTIKAALMKNGKIRGNIVSGNYVFHKAFAKPVKYQTPYSSQYMSGGEFGLVDGVRGSKNFYDGQWQAWESVDMNATVDLEKETSISKLSLGAFQRIGSWIYMPLSVEYYISNDGKDFKLLGSVKNDVSPQMSDVCIKDFTLKFSPVRTRFVKVIAKNRGVGPEGSVTAGGNTWIFVDELLVE
ncbi:MAG: family 20 glycosylhydrolase [Bacteroidota bacterium]|nr:family 20 glycosylhydrolase [Bacteroidota bacterium]